MGMFDEVLIEVPIPDLPSGKLFDGACWQTKDFEMPYLDLYRISAAGRLEREAGHSEPLTDAEREEMPASLREWRTTKWIRDGWEDIAYHGMLDLCHIADYGKPSQEFVELRATFTHGQLEKLERVSATPTPSTEEQRDA